MRPKRGKCLENLQKSGQKYSNQGEIAIFIVLDSQKSQLQLVGLQNQGFIRGSLTQMLKSIRFELMQFYFFLRS
jgi:hypothetical protein